MLKDAGRDGRQVFRQILKTIAVRGALRDIYVETSSPESSGSNFCVGCISVLTELLLLLS